MSDPTEAEAARLEGKRREKVKDLGDMLYFLSQKLTLDNLQSDKDRYQNMEDVLKRSITTKMSSPWEINNMKRTWDFFMRYGYGKIVVPTDFTPADYGKPKGYPLWVEKGKQIVALAERAFALANQRMIDKHEAKFEDDDKEEGGEVVYDKYGNVVGKGPGGKVVGSGRRRYSVR